jgi:hypothetical protein
MNQQRRTKTQADRKLFTRLPAILEHIPYYSFQGQARLAADAGTSRSTIHRLVHHKCIPSFALVFSIQRALEGRLGRKILIEEWLSLDNTWPTASPCELLGCPGCLPEQAYNPNGSLKSAFENMRPGTWTVDDLQKEGV